MKKLNFTTVPSKVPLVMLLLLAIFSSACSSSRKFTQNLNRNFDENPVFKNAFSGFIVYDPESKEVLYDHNAHKYFTPASNTKLLTYYTAVKLLGDSIPHLKYFQRNDTLFIAGTGDPSLLNPYLPESPALAMLKESPHPIVLVPEENYIPRMGPGWGWDDYNAYYSAERSAFPVYGNLIRFEFQSGKKEPSVSPAIFKDSLKILPDTSLSRVLRKPWSNELQYYNPEKNKDFKQNVPIFTSAQTTAILLQEALGKPVIISKGVSKMPFSTLYSTTASDSIYKLMLQESDNFVAEQILLMAAEHISDTLKPEIAIDYMKKTYLLDLPDAPQWRDGSGMSRYNLITPRSVVKLLEKIKDEVPYEKIFSIFPAGGESGTLKNRLKADKPFVFAKTGTLGNVHSVSGYLKADSGRILIFSFMNTNFTAPGAQLRANMDTILTTLKEKY